MSLIDEALRRAQSVRRSGGTDSNSPDPWAAAPLPDRRRGRQRLVPAVIVLLVVGVGGFALLRRSHGTRGELPRIAEPAARRPVISPPPPPTAASESAAGGLASEPRNPTPRPRASAPASAPDAPTAAVSLPSKPPEPRIETSRDDQPTAAVVARPPVHSEPMTRVRSASSSPPIAASVVTTPAPAVRPHTPAAPERGRGVHVGEVAVPGGHIELGGIVYSETNPVAVLNGHILGVGAVVDGFTVVSIEENRVELKNEHRTVVLTLR